MSHDRSVIDILEEISANLGAGGSGGVPQSAFTRPGWEDLVVRWSVCTGTFHFTPTGPVITIRGDLYTLDGRPDGSWEGVDSPTPDGLGMAFAQPSEPPGPFDTPDDSPVERLPAMSWSKGIWRFADGSTITAWGPAQLRAVQWVDPDDEGRVTNGQLWVSGEQIVTGGTGRYAGVQGLKTVTGTAWIPPGPDNSTPNFQAGGDFPARVVDVFRLVRRQHIGPFAPPGPGPRPPSPEQDVLWLSPQAVPSPPPGAGGGS